MRSRMLKVTAVAASMVVLTGADMAARAKEKMRCSHQLPPGFHIAKVIDRWAAEVEALSGGDIDVQIFGANALVGARQNIPSVARGTIECAFSGNFQWGKTLPVMNVTLRPYSVTSPEMIAAWPDSEVAAYLEKKLLKKGVRNISWMFTSRMSAVTSKGKALLEPGDFKGVKIRGLNPTVNAGLQALGAAPSAMSGSEVYQALSTGVIDAGLTDIGAAYARKYFEVQDQIVATPMFSVFYHGYVNPDWYDALSDRAKAALSEAGRKAADWALEATEKATGAAPFRLAGENVTVHIHTADQIDAMATRMRPAFDKAFAEASGDDSGEILELLEKLAR